MPDSKSDAGEVALSTPSTCPRCGATFECGTQAGAERCWCAELPPIGPVSEELACFCPRCLREIVEAKSRPR